MEFCKGVKCSCSGIHSLEKGVITSGETEIVTV